MMHRYWMLAIDSEVVVPAGATVEIDTITERSFHPERFVVQPFIAPSFLIRGITINDDEDRHPWGVEDFIPADFFSSSNPQSFVMNLGFFKKDSHVYINVVNISAGALRFFGMLYGELTRD